MKFERGHPKFDARQKGTLDKKVVAREQLAAHSLRVAGLTPRRSQRVHLAELDGCRSKTRREAM